MARGEKVLRGLGQTDDRRPALFIPGHLILAHELHLIVYHIVDQGLRILGLQELFRRRVLEEILLIKRVKLPERRLDNGRELFLGLLALVVPRRTHDAPA